MEVKRCENGKRREEGAEQRKTKLNQFFFVLHGEIQEIQLEQQRRELSRRRVIGQKQQQLSQPRHPCHTVWDELCRLQDTFIIIRIIFSPLRSRAAPLWLSLGRPWFVKIISLPKKNAKTHRIYKRNFAYFFYAKHPNPKGKSPSSSSSFTHSTDCMLLCVSSYDVDSHDEPAQAGRQRWRRNRAKIDAGRTTSSNWSRALVQQQWNSLEQTWKHNNSPLRNASSLWSSNTLNICAPFWRLA